MSAAPDQWAPGSFTTVLPGVYVGDAQRLLSEDLARLIVRLAVDSRVGLPDMFEITFAVDRGTTPVTAEFAIGTPVSISAAAPTRPQSPGSLMSGEVTALEASFAATATLTVRGYSKDHRLQRATRSRTFLQMTDADIARKLATEAGLTVGVIDETATVHDQVVQLNQTDWDFLTARAAALGFDVGMAYGKFQFRQVPVAGADGVELTFPSTLRTFSPRITAGNLCPEYEVRVWDPLAATVSDERTPAATGPVHLPGPTPAALGALFSDPTPDASEPNPLGPPPSQQAQIAINRPAVTGQATAAQASVRGMADRITGTVAEADGVALGDPRLAAGAVADISGVAAPFAGQWLLCRVQHVFDDEGYHTRFEAGGHQDRSLLGLATRGAARSTALSGLVCGIVTNVGDWDDNDQTRGRVKVTLPWLSPTFETGWAPVIHPGAGQASGTVFLPETGDEVVLGFELGDPNRPYVLGGVVNAHSTFTLGGPSVQKMGEAAAVVRRGIVSPSGSMLVFHNESTPGQTTGPPQASEIVLGTGSGSLSLVLDEVAGTATLRCDPQPPNSQQERGQLVIECGAGGTVEIRSGPDGTVTVDGGGVLNLTAQQTVRIQSAGEVEITGQVIKLN
nr:VgrG-related protein [Kibdelosporangium sp. MJ126-NF4]CEL12811.1 VgrG protein [Kibdelosporangium sp. MJ126-NF4]CTQ98497.1 VgrG protein [Kibdelosporangium sp. MJ126-NF4]